MITKEKEIAVIGGGIIGICSAIELAHLGYKVSLIDQNEIAVKSCSIGNAGNIATNVLPLISPATLLKIPQMLIKPYSGLSIPLKTFRPLWFMQCIKAAFGKRFKNSVLAMSYLSHRCIEDSLNLYAKAKMSEHIKLTNCLFLYENKKELNQSLKKWQLKKELGFDYEIVETNKLYQIEPSLKKGAFYAAVMDKKWAIVSDPKLVLLALFNYAKKIGIEFTQAKLGKINNQAKMLNLELEFDSGKKKTMNFAKVVIASGVSSANIAQKVGDKLPLIAERGYNITFENPNFKLNYPILIYNRELSVSSLTSGFRFGGFAEYSTKDYPVNEKQFAKLAVLADKFFNPISKQKPTQWSNSRPTLPDSIPVICASSKMDNLYYCCGHSHWGLGFSATSGKMIADIIDKEKSDLPKEYDYFSLTRFQS